MTVKRAYAIAYILLVPSLLCLFAELLGTFGDGMTSSSRYISPMWGALIASAHLNLLLYAWVTACKKREVVAHPFLAFVLHLLLSVPVLGVSVVRLPLLVYAGFVSRPDTVRLLMVLGINAAFWIGMVAFRGNHRPQRATGGVVRATSEQSPPSRYSFLDDFEEATGITASPANLVFAAALIVIPITFAVATVKGLVTTANSLMTGALFMLAWAGVAIAREEIPAWRLSTRPITKRDHGPAFWGIVIAQIAFGAILAIVAVGTAIM